MQLAAVAAMVAGCCSPARIPVAAVPYHHLPFSVWEHDIQKMERYGCFGVMLRGLAAYRRRDVYLRALVQPSYLTKCGMEVR